MRRGGFLLVLGLLLLAIAPHAHAAFHLMKVREVHPGTALAPDRAFIELQMLAAGQNQVNGHEVVVYDAAGGVTATVVMGANVPNGESQRTILLGDLDVTDRDFVANVGTLVNPAGGAVCFPDATPADCVAWGSFAAAGALPAPVGAPAAPGGIPDGSSITRDIARECPTALDAADDTDDSSADFAITTPTPRPNSAVPSETACAPGGGPDLALSGKKTQKAGGKVVVKARCADQDCSLVAKGKSRLKGGAKSSATASAKKRVKLKRDTADAAAGEIVKLKLKHSKSGKKKVRRAVRKGGKATAVVRVTATGAGGAATIERFKAKLKR